ncbi:hypothetical protein A1O3_06633 [Capronia epimyces CBS 606.96]|uniref:chitin deacetylase n=1 Tax=Capronia epimyces CBS 606.96 TaxID=1182542 RepID=W9XRG7_9EURO|nr:uncharacterized protein A1O3_06633 [Capronia epimyces CBS 606.96]EXJ82818.1 hypothetical protein A1O3_06633 [Capronia epimyces CBS 606.96]
MPFTTILPVVFSCFGLCFLVLLYVIYKPPSWLIDQLQRRWPDVLFQVSTTSRQKMVALTIDDGPSASTAEIQAILDGHGAKATFFLIGSHMPGREETLRELVRSGHELANHAMRDEPSRALPAAELSGQIRRVDTQLQEIYDSNRAGSGSRLQQPSSRSRSRYFRPGSGFFSTSMRKVVADSGGRIVLGSIYPHDAQIPFWKLNARHILSMLRPGAIIVCHDRSWTAPMLRAVLPELRTRGYHVVTVTELLNATDG